MMQDTAPPSGIPAAQYLRMSKVLQELSIPKQVDAIKRYADQNGFEIVQTYCDPGKSGLLLRHRLGLARLLQDVVCGDCSYKAILVYDVSRWGRFQDVDESAHYEFLCRQAGVAVHYCAETFSNDGSLSSSLLKALKRSMAAEYSRELGIKTLVDHKQIVQMGFRAGGGAGYGFRRLSISRDGTRKQILKAGEYKGLQTDRVILVPEPQNEVEVVREIYDMALRKRVSDIVRELNARGIRFLAGRQWTYCSLFRLLTNPKYYGANVWGRTTQRLLAGNKRVASQQWIEKPDAFTPIVDKRTFDRVRAAHERRKQKIPNEKLLRALKRLLAAEGRLTEVLIDRSRSTWSSATYVRHFGSMRRAYELIDYQPSPRSLRASATVGRRNGLRTRLFEQIEALFPVQVKRMLFRNRRTLLQLDNGSVVSVLLCMYYKTPSEGKVRWELIPFPAECDLITLICLLDQTNEAFHGFWVQPRISYKTEYQIKGETDPWLLQGRRLGSLDDFHGTVTELATLYPLRLAALTLPY